MVTKWTRSLLVLGLLASVPTLAAGQNGRTRPSTSHLDTFSRGDLLITHTAVDDATQRITITGENLTRSSRRSYVYLGRTLLQNISTSDTQIVAQLPINLAAGTYLLIVANGSDNDNFDSIDVAIGVAGPTGPQGPQGLQGFTGAQGAQGAQGADGAVGPQGPAGATGAVGPQGPAGAEGPAGATGAVGPQGPQGPAGPSGADGAVGTQGPAGANGTNGLDGAPGETGPQGPQGAEGAAGPAGPQGPSGFVNVLGYENAVSFTITTFLNSPAACQTAAYVAGANETALVSVDVTTLSDANDTLFLAPLFTVNGGPRQFGVQFLTAGPINAYAHGSLHNQAMIQLTAGASYRFMTGVRTMLGNAPTKEFTCRGLVTIVRRP